MYSISLRTVSYLRRYCSRVSNFLRSGRADEGWFLLFGVPNAKYLAFGTPDESALTCAVRGTLNRPLYLFLRLTLSFSQTHYLSVVLFLFFLFFLYCIGHPCLLVPTFVSIFIWY